MPILASHRLCYPTDRYTGCQIRDSVTYEPSSSKSRTASVNHRSGGASNFSFFARFLAMSSISSEMSSCR